MAHPQDKSVVEIHHDIDSDLYGQLLASSIEDGLAIDIETTGLDPQLDSIKVISLATTSDLVVLVTGDERPARLVQLLGDQRVRKIAHNAVFDLSFIRHRWNVALMPIFCTKVAARIAGIDQNPHLADLVKRYAGVSLDKTIRLSNWSNRPLTSTQIQYAADDVRYLHQLKNEMTRALAERGTSEMFAQTMEFLPTRVDLDLLGLGDVFAYRV